MANGEHLLVPIKVQALVIDDAVIDRRATLMTGPQSNVAGDGKWSPLEQDYRPLVLALDSAAPRPFYDAKYEDQGEKSSQLVLPEGSPAVPEKKHCGVYLHWVLPSGLRHAYKPGSLDFPALPDQWLIVRFSRRRAEPQTKAWFVDGGLVLDSPNEPANLVVPSGDKYAARRGGKVVPLDKFSPAEFQGEHKTITAIGNPQTGSPTFTASIAENRNILSWHDDLDDLREQGKVPSETALSYLLLGWYRDVGGEPLAALPVKVIEKKQPETPGWLIDPPGWFIPSARASADDPRGRQCLFHGMVAHINYWNRDRYKGPMLGYPGSPPVPWGGLGDAKPSFKVGVGNNAEDALVSLVSSESSRRKDAPDLWKALEAVIYRQAESLVASWNAAPRDAAVHQRWFTSPEAGKVWAIRPRPDYKTGPEDQAGQVAPRPTRDHLAELRRLNDLQSKADALGRELAALQQDLYARWWKLSRALRLDDPMADPTTDQKAYAELAGRAADLSKRLKESLGCLPSQVEKLKKMLPEALELYWEAAPRFWEPTDPVVILKNCGLPNKHRFPQPLPCRLPEQTVASAEVVVGGDPKRMSPADSVTETALAVRTHFASRGQTLTRLLEEASLVEQAINSLVERTISLKGSLPSDEAWRDWTDELLSVVTWDSKAGTRPPNQINLRGRDASRVSPHQLADLWVEQPWSPLFLDWQVTWRPTVTSAKDFGPIWQKGDYDYYPGEEGPPTEGFTVRGRSLLSPIDGRIFNEPIEALRELLEYKPGPRENEGGKPAFPPEVRDVLYGYKEVWDLTLKELAGTGMMAQALTGFHQTLLRRDVTMPRVMPDPARPWAEKDAGARGLLDLPDEAVSAPERLAPPFSDDPPLPFTLVRAGAFRLDELWLIDDFGQWADLIKGNSRGGAAGLVFNPRVRWHDDPFAVAMPPRVLQPVRLNFRFAAADVRPVESDVDPVLSPICGWVFYNPLDQALVLCHRDGQLAGELVIIEEQRKFRVEWEAGAGGVPIVAIRDKGLKDFAQALVQTELTATPRLNDLLKLIDGALERIRPAAARRDAALFGRPLALVKATLGLELFGRAWTDPHGTAPAVAPGTGNETLDRLRVRVGLGCSHNVEDGLVGYFKGDSYDRIVPAPLPGKADRWPSGYVGHATDDAIEVGFGGPETLTLLMDPWGSVQAAAGLVPAKSITLAHPDLDKTLARMEASFRVGPVLLEPGRLALPTPVGENARWSFSGPLTNNQAALVTPSDPRHFGDRPVVAAEGRLLLLASEE